MVRKATRKATKKPWCSASRTTRCRKGIGKLAHGDLGLFGYEHVTTMTLPDRHRSLTAAVRQYGALSVWRKLNAIAVLTRRTAPAASAVFKSDRDWVKVTFE